MRSAMSSVVLAAAVLLVARGTVAAGPDSSTGTHAVLAAASEALGGIEGRIERMQRDVGSMRLHASARATVSAALDAPPSFERKIDRLKHQLEATLLPLRGRPWVEVQPLVQRVARLRDRLDRMLEQLEAPIAPRTRLASKSALPPPGTGRITGRVSDAVTGAPLAATVQLYDLSGSYLGSYEAQRGDYAVDGLAAGTYFLFAFASSWGSGYVGELYDNVPCDPWCEITSGTPVVVIEYQTRA
jgi:hypothetical protein